ncbi:hypothetical protein TsFJ059_001366 [Trichoderma semiorbis]|uniref:Uncharacterized protein n=1 Tax=Trichoderma semiorbis TaxID=1491008 RepID=A0A9P8HS37_9HYPO|nr:hypothetical protein TsFJ059_001366 [Trichoderma semiorbis]
MDACPVDAIDTVNTVLALPVNLTAMYKNTSEGRLADSKRKMVDIAAKRFPELADAMVEESKSLIELRNKLGQAALEDSRSYRELASTQIQLNKTQAWGIVTTANATERIAEAIEDVSATVARNSETIAGAIEDVSTTFAHNTETIAASFNMVAENSQRIADSADYVVRELHGIQLIGRSLVDHINYYGRWMQTVSAIQIAQGYQAIQVLTDISEHLGEANNIAVSGSGGPNGFAQHVYDFINERVDEVDPTEGDTHRFFVYHPDTNWYGAFHRLIREDPLSPMFCAKSDNLDTLCQFMQHIRTQLNAESDDGKSIVFHLLIPSWYRISIKEPLHFPESLQPFRVEGRKHKGSPLVSFNLPAAPAKLLNGVANVLDPKSQNTIAEGVSAAVTLPTVGWGINGACLAAGAGLGVVTGLGALIAIPVWIVTAVPTMGIAAPVISETIYDALREEAPRVIGSTRRLNLGRMS